MDTPNPGNQPQEANVPTPRETPPAPASSAQDGTRKTLLFTYVLYIVGLFVGLATIIGLIVAYIKRKDAQGTWMESHFT